MLSGAKRVLRLRSPFRHWISNETRNHYQLRDDVRVDGQTEMKPLRSQFTQTALILAAVLSVATSMRDVSCEIQSVRTTEPEDDIEYNNCKCSVGAPELEGDKLTDPDGKGDNHE